jgi:hypothetical protein
MGFPNSFGTAKVRTQRPQVIAHLRTQEISKRRQGYHTCNRTTQHLMVNVQQFDLNKCL